MYMSDRKSTNENVMIPQRPIRTKDHHGGRHDKKQ